MRFKRERAKLRLLRHLAATIFILTLRSSALSPSFQTFFCSKSSERHLAENVSSSSRESVKQTRRNSRSNAFKRLKVYSRCNGLKRDSRLHNRRGGGDSLSLRTNAIVARVGCKFRYSFSPFELFPVYRDERAWIFEGRREERRVRRIRRISILVVSMGNLI